MPCMMMLCVLQEDVTFVCVLHRIHCLETIIQFNINNKNHEDFYIDKHMTDALIDLVQR